MHWYILWAGLSPTLALQVSFNFIPVFRSCLIIISLRNPDYFSRSYQSSWEAKEKSEILCNFTNSIDEINGKQQEMLRCTVPQCPFIDECVYLAKRISILWLLCWLVQRIRHKKKRVMNRITLAWFHLALSKTKTCQCICNILMIN